jgi:hypothetical protein
MQHEEVCGCDTCDWQDRCREEAAEPPQEEEQEEEQEQEQHDCWRERHERRQQRAWEEQNEDYLVPRCSDYLATCDSDRCTYECAVACGSSVPADVEPKHEPVGTTLPPIDSCLYGCIFSCGAKQGEDCIAEFDAEGNQLPPLVESVVNAAIDSDDDMPGLISLSAHSNFEENEIEIVDPPAAPQPKPPKAKPLFPYNHHLWPSPRAKVLVRSILGKQAKRLLNVDTLTHDACMRYLAMHYGLSHEQLLKTSIFDLHNRERVAWTRDSPKPYMQLPPICGCCYCRYGRRGPHRW